MSTSVSPDTTSTLSARFYIPSSLLSASPPPKLPVVLYFHGGAFIVCSIASPDHHNSLNAIVSHSETILVSFDYRRCPEHPLPVVYDDSWSFLSWIISQSKFETPDRDPWLERHADFGNIFLAGDSCGANISHHLALRASRSLPGLSFQGMIMIHPYFWGKEPIGREKDDDSGRRTVDSWWQFVCPSNKGNDDPLSNNACITSYGNCGREGHTEGQGEAVLRDADGEEPVEREGRWKGKAEIFETEGAEHVFHIFNPEGNKAKDMFKRLASFIHEN